MPVDTSIYAPQAPVNPLQTAGQFITASNGLEQNKLLQLGQQSAQLGINKQQLDLANQHFSTMNDRFGSLLADPELNVDKVNQAASDMVKEQLITPQEAAIETAKMPSDPQQLRGFINQHLLRNMDAQQKLNAVYGQTVTGSDGANTYSGTQASPMMGGGLNVASQYPMQVSPSERASRFGVIQNGQRGTQPIGDTLPPANALTVHQTGTQPDQGSNPLTGAPLAQSMPQPTDDQPSQPQQSQAAKAAGFVPSEPQVGFPKMQEASIDRVNQIKADASTAQTKLAPMKQIMQLMDEGIQTGNGKDFLNKVKSTLISNGVPLDAGDTTGFQTLQKLMASNMVGQGGATDAARDLIQHANVNDKMLPQTIKEVIPYAMAGAMTPLMRQAVYNKQGVDGSDPAKEAAIKQQFDQASDPRAIQLMMMKDGHKAFFDKIPKQADKDQVMANVKALTNLGATDALK